MEQGADMCCDSLHKTLPVLTGGALLHVKNPAYLADAKRRMSLFGSTSPSYLIMLSADSVLGYLEDGIANHLAIISRRIAALKTLAEQRGFLLPRGMCDPIRLTLGFSPLGFDGAGFRAYLARHQIEPELCADGYAVFLAGGANSEEDFRRLHGAIAELPMGSATLPEPTTPSSIPVQALTLREAVFAPCEQIPVENALGRIASSVVSLCPPGIPIALPGERIDENRILLLKKYGILWLNVIR
jgi:arginine/lysine/ornithine decarboxylase